MGEQRGRPGGRPGPPRRDTGETAPCASLSVDQVRQLGHLPFGQLLDDPAGGAEQACARARTAAAELLAV